LIRVGILGTARIARSFFSAPLRNARILAIASREQSKADAFGDEFKIPHRYGSYERLLDDPDIDAVYIPLPQHLHCEYTIKAAQAGKHVLVEKPAALNAAEIQSMMAACQHSGVFLMEAFMYRFKSIQRRVKEIIASGQIGNITYIDFNWCFNIRNLVRSAFRMDRLKGGGAMYDLGIYGIDFIRFITGHEPELVNATIRRESRDGVDMFAHIEYAIGDAIATVTAAFNTDANYYAIGGEKGSLLARSALSGRSVENTLQIHMLEVDTQTEEKFPPENPFIAELEYFARCIEHKEKPFPDAENSLKNLRLLEEVFAKAMERVLS
jgi:predicted dehydrogenase